MSNRPEIKKWVSLLAVIGFIVFIVYLLFFTDLVRVAAIILGLNIPIYLLVFIFSILGVGCNALAWKATLDNVSVKTTVKRVFNLVWVGAFLDSIIVGGWSGDLFVTYLLSRDKGVDIIKVAASVIVKDIIELLVIFMSLIVGIILLVLNYSINSFILVAVGITMVFLALPLILIVYLSTNISITTKLLNFVVKLIEKIKHTKSDESFERNIATQITNFHDVIMIIKNKPKSMIKPIIFQTMGWVCDITALFLVFTSLGTIVGFDKIIITNTIVGNITSQGVALAGFSQIISSGLYQILGINISLAQAASLMSGFAGFWFKFVIAFIFFEMYGLGTIAEKLLNKAFKEKTKRDKKDFKQQTNSNQRGFEEKTENDKKDFKELLDNNESDYKEQKDIIQRDFDVKTDTDKSDRKEQRDIHRKDFKEKTESDRAIFEELRDSNETNYNENREKNRQAFEDKTSSDRAEFEKIRDVNETDYNKQKEDNKRDFDVKTDTDKSDRKEQRDIHRKDFKEKTDSDKKDFDKLSYSNKSDYEEQKIFNEKDFNEKTDSDKSSFKEQKEKNKKDFKEKMDKDKKDFIDKNDSEK
jgi:uncharacterized protein (TIRG00374 family)